MTEAVPDETTLCKFRHLLETNDLNKLFFDAINRVMAQTGHMMKGGTIVDATIISAPSSTKNADKARDPEMHQTKKGNEWKFGMKCHIGVDAGSGYSIKNLDTLATQKYNRGKRRAKTWDRESNMAGSTGGSLKTRRGKGL